MKSVMIVKRLIALAQENVDIGGWPFSAIITKNSEIVADAVNSVHKSNDPSDHAEVAAIRKATAKLNSTDLSEYTVYMLAPPCPMCYTCMVLANVKQATYILDADRKGRALSTLPPTLGLYKSIKKGFENGKVTFTRNESYSDIVYELMQKWDSFN